MTVELTEEQMRWLSGLLRGFLDDPVYELDSDELRERFLVLLDSEMERGRDDDDISPRIEREMLEQVFGPNSKQEKEN